MANVNKIFSEYSMFRKSLNSAIRSKDMIDVNYKYDLDVDFYRQDAENIELKLDEMKKALIEVQKALK